MYNPFVQLYNDKKIARSPILCLQIVRRMTEVIVIESQAFRRLVSELKNQIEESMANALEQLAGGDVWLPPDEAKAILGIKSKSKMQQLRDTDQIVFSQHGRNIMYHRPSLIQLLEKHRNISEADWLARLKG